MRSTLALLSVVAVLVALASTAALAQAGGPKTETPADESRAKKMEETLNEEEATLLDCDDVATQRGAQALFELDPEDRFGLDKDGDGEACEAGSGGAAEDGTKVGAKTGGDLDCVDFKSQKAAQASLRKDPTDPQGLDPEHNGVACEIRPAEYKDVSTDLAPVAKAKSGVDLDCADFEYREEAMMVWFRDQSDPNDLGKGQPQHERREGEPELATDPAVCAELQMLPTSGEEVESAPTGSQGSSPAVFIAAWPRGGGLGFFLDLAALLLVTSGVLSVLVTRRLRSPGPAS